MFKRATRLAAIAMAIAAAGCAGTDGSQGPQGPQGNQGTPGQDLTATAKPETCTVCHASQGASHQASYNASRDASKLSATISAVDVDGATSVLTVHLAVSYNGAGATLADLGGFAKKGFYAVTYNPATREFDGTSIATFNNRFIADGSGIDGQFLTTATAGRAVPNMVVGWFAQGVLNSEGNLYDNYANFIWTDGTVNYQSQASASGCARCHGTPFLKGGYRSADKTYVAGASADFLLCKGCHYDTRAGHDADWQRMVDAPANYATTTITSAQNTQYAYKAKVMNDVHMAHAMEFPYPMSMSNCATCHTTQAQLDAVLADSNYALATCRSCHPVTGPANAADAQANRAPSLISLMTNPALTYQHGPQVANDTTTTMSKLYANSTSQPTCTGCHDGTSGPTFKTVHNGGYNKRVATATGTRYQDATKISVTGATYNKSTHVATVTFGVTGAPANALIKPTVVASLYGYETKDFVVSGHSSQFTDKTPNLEWSQGATVRNSNPPVSANTSRLTVAPATATQGNTSWVATLDLTTWAAMIDAGQVKQIEVGMLPTMALDPTQASSATNPTVAIAGATQTVAVTATSTDARIAAGSVYGKAIVDVAKCNACHDALGTTFHDTNYGSAGVVACRLCHFPGSGSSHLELQSRSIDSFVHAIHEFQYLDTAGVDFTNPLKAWRYDEHVKSSFPAALTNCESCHAAGTYNPPANDRSLPSIVSGVATSGGAPIAYRGTTDFRRAAEPGAKFLIPSTIGSVPSYITGPGARACGGCHRGYAVNSNSGAGLMGYIDHTGAMGYAIPAASSTDATSKFNAAVQAVMQFFQ